MGFAILFVQLTMVGTILSATPSTAASQTKPGCATTCGNLSIPFPFGTTPDCYLDPSFLITCNETHFNPPQPFLELSNIHVLNVSLDGLIHVSSYTAQDCYNQTGLPEAQTAFLQLRYFFISTTLNKFTAVGCDTVAVVVGTVGENYTTGCLSLCDHVGSVTNGSCAGVGCCQTAIPQGVKDFEMAVTSLKNHSLVRDFNPCGYAFVVEEAAFRFSSLDLKDLQKRETFPVVLDWAVGNETCEEAMKNSSTYACQALNSQCLNSTNGPGYRCSCTSGYQGNPYLIDGCQDINECETSKPCNGTYGTCTNLPGTFSCGCLKGYQGDGTKNGTGCYPEDQSEGSTLIHIALGISTGLLALVVGSGWVYWILRKRNLIKLREKFFQQNGGIMLQQQLSKHEGSVETARIFTAEDLKKATNNYEETRIIGQGGFGTVYKGVLSDDRIVAIKKSKVSDQTQIEQFINEVVVLSQINHRNVVKLLGCCLETEVPLLVYEFITNGTLSDHIHNEDRATLVSWEIRLKIAAEAAGALAYLHSATSPAIIHRDIKSTNILLDNTYAAKVSDFGASRLVPLGHTQLTTLVQGTFGYLDPEYFHSSQLTEKSDVYSFGVVLAELLTGEKAISFDRQEKDRNLAMYFVSSMKEDRLFHILDKRMLNDGSFDELKEVAKLAKRCLRVNGEDRPTMKEVATELEGIIRMMERHPLIEVDLYTEETEQLLIHSLPSNGYKVGVDGHNGCTTSTTIGYDSIRDQIIVALDDGR
ncbi:putative wall-associated receptor kinase-like 16 [Cornus florida]|uniref:putative wall-associated receptor kinase-like 16 n=1 Tax=Cornus florida TaxID=4283 RepID=UPI002899D965|nr:putative wall-associated receptor kinase-like 16 [Cornus florida]